MILHKVIFSFHNPAKSTSRPFTYFEISQILAVDFETNGRADFVKTVDSRRSGIYKEKIIALIEHHL